MIITAGLYKGRKVSAPSEKITRPTLSKTRMGVFNTLYSIMGSFEEKTFLDVFGGSGIMGLEALSRGFAKVKVFELNKKSADMIKKNYEFLGLEPDIEIGDSIKLLDRIQKKFDVAYVDPPYESNYYEKVLLKLNCNIVVTESSLELSFDGYELIKQKKYGTNIVSFFSRK